MCLNLCILVHMCTYLCISTHICQYLCLIYTDNVYISAIVCVYICHIRLNLCICVHMCVYVCLSVQIKNFVLNKTLSLNFFFGYKPVLRKGVPVCSSKSENSLIHTRNRSQDLPVLCNRPNHCADSAVKIYILFGTYFWKKFQERTYACLCVHSPFIS